MNRAIAIIDECLDDMLKYPGMFVGGGTPECHHCFFVLLLSHLSVRARILEAEFNWRGICRALLIEMTGRHSGSLGPNSRLREYYGDRSFEHGDPNHGNVMLFYREFVARLRTAMEQSQ